MRLPLHSRRRSVPACGHPVYVARLVDALQRPKRTAGRLIECAMPKQRLATALFLGLLATAHASQSPPEPPFAIAQLGTNVWAALSNPKAASPSFVNAGFVIGRESVAVVDTLGSAEHARGLLAEVRKKTSLPIKYVVDTHYHIDHTAGNGVFAESGAAIVAHRNVRAWLRSENLRLVGPQIPPEVRAEIERLPLPTTLVDRRANLDLGSREIQVRAFPGHTGSDVVVVVPDARVVFAGDLFWRQIIPNTIDATTSDWIRTLATLSRTLDRYTFVPGHGDPGSAQDVSAFGGYLRTLQRLVAQARREGKSADALVKAVMPLLGEQYRSWESYEGAAPDNISMMDDELAARKRVPRAR
jgi:glyoxylase-like metal-dependent hydrolase (beta-lactamase superfamily II)